MFVTSTQAQLIIKANDGRTDGPITTCAYAWQYSVNTRLERILYTKKRQIILNLITLIMRVKFVYRLPNGLEKFCIVIADFLYFL